MAARAIDASAKEVPAHLLAACRRIDRTINIEWDEFRKRWVVTRRSGGQDRCFVGGRWQHGRHIVIRWQDPETQEYLPLDWRLYRRLDDMDSARRKSWEAHMKELTDAEARRETLKANDSAERHDAARAYFDSRGVKARVWSVAGIDPGELTGGGF